MIEYETMCPTCKKPYSKAAQPESGEDYGRITREVGDSAENYPACVRKAH